MPPSHFEIGAWNSCRIIVPTLFKEEYLDGLRVLTRDGNPKPFLDATRWIHKWAAAFHYEDLDKVIADMTSCNAFEKSRALHKLSFPSKG